MRCAQSWDDLGWRDWSRVRRQGHKGLAAEALVFGKPAVLHQRHPVDLRQGRCSARRERRCVDWRGLENRGFFSCRDARFDRCSLRLRVPTRGVRR